MTSGTVRLLRDLRADLDSAGLTGDTYSRSIFTRESVMTTLRKSSVHAVDCSS